jgi:hypothetical protein
MKTQFKMKKSPASIPFYSAESFLLNNIDDLIKESGPETSQNF